LGKPEEINSNSVIVVAAIGIVVNGLMAWLFMKGKKHDLYPKRFCPFRCRCQCFAWYVVAGMKLEGISAIQD